MLNRIIFFSIRNKLLVALGIMALVIYGALSFARLPIDAVPDITNNQVQVITVSPSLGAPEVERLITFPVEQAVASIQHIQEMRSFSRFGLSVVTIVFTEETDVYWARQQVTERLTQVQADIPTSIGTPQLGPITTGLGEIYQYVLRPAPGFEARYPPMELRTIQDWIVRRQLLGTPGVADVSSFGGYLKQYEISIDPMRLNSMKVSMEEIFMALEANNQNTGGAYIEKSQQSLFIRSEGMVQSPADLEQIVVKRTSTGNPVLIRDVAEVKYGHATRYGALSYNDQGEVAGAVVMMVKGANSSEVVKNVKAKIDQIQKTLPEGVVIDAFLDRSKMVDSAISTVETNLIEGALIVIFILVLFLGNLRAGFIVASVIPLSMLFAVICMNLFGVSGNLMSLGALDFGLIVDGAVIIVEAVMHRLRHSKTYQQATTINQQQMNQEVGTASSKMMNAAVFGQIIILIVYLPILSLKGIEGKMFKPMAQTVSFAILGAFLLSITYVPMVSSWVLSKKITHHDTLADRMMKKLENLYRPLLEKALEKTKWMILGAALLLTGSIWLLTTLGGEFIPQLEEGDFAVETRMLTGTSLSTGIEYTKQAAQILNEQFPEVEKVVSKIGTGEIPTDPMPMDIADMIVVLKPKKEWVSAGSYEELAEKMGEALQAVPGISVGFQYPVQMRFNELMTGARQDVVCKIFGENLDSLAHYAALLGQKIGTISGAKDIYVESIGGLPQVVVRYHREALARFGISVEEVNNLVRSAFAGEVAGKVFEGERRFDLVVRMDAAQRLNIESLENLMIPVSNGSTIPLHQVAEVKIEVGPNQIQREDAKRRIAVGFNVRGRDVASIVEELQQKVGAQIKLPPGYFIYYGGQFENLQEAQKRLSVAVPVSLMLILLLLYFAFGSWKQGLLIFSAIPLSAIGGVLSLWLRGMPFSISAGVGFIALFGVAVLNGIVLITEFNRLRQKNRDQALGASSTDEESNLGTVHTKELVVKGSLIRLRPVLMTAAVASLGFLPMALSGGAGAEVQRPLATVVIGGLFTATLLTLFILPALYVWAEEKRPQKPQKKSKDTMKSLLLPFLLTMTGILAFTQEKSALAQSADPQKLGDHSLFSPGAGSTANQVRQTTGRNLDSLWQQALAENKAIRFNESTIEYKKALEKTAVQWKPLGIDMEYGNVNSYFRDDRWGLNQSFRLPGYYQKFRSMLVQETAVAGKQVEIEKIKILQLTALHYYHWLYWNDRILMLERILKGYAGSFKREELRLRKGAGNKSDYNLALQQFEFQKQELLRAQQERNLSEIQLKWLSPGSSSLLQHSSLNEANQDLQQRLQKIGFASTYSNTESKEGSSGEERTLGEEERMNQHPLLQEADARIQLAAKKKSLIQSEKLPELTIGFYNMSVIGWQRIEENTERYFSRNQRFTALQAGISLPLWGGYWKKQEKAASIFQQQALQEKKSIEAELQAQWRTLTEKVTGLQEQEKQYKSALLPATEESQKLAQLQLEKGEINYMQWNLLQQQSSEQQLRYLELQLELLTSKLSLYFLQLKNANDVLPQ
jgi:cobalt-zinc-cadmium resistance protein CzcA